MVVLYPIKKIDHIPTEDRPYYELYRPGTLARKETAKAVQWSISGPKSVEGKSLDSFFLINL